MNAPTNPNARFFSRFVQELPADPEQRPGVRQVFEACYSRIEPTAVEGPSLLAYSSEMANVLGFDESEVGSERFARVFSGNELFPGMVPHAACYGGHQFGNWAGQLGDGRAISLGETRGTDGALWELQLKGAGPTPYSRRADGRAVLRSSVREFLCSEAMFHLGVPTTRALSLTSTGEQVMRDMFYDGHPEYEPGAIVCRVAPSFLRFGNFELFASRGDEATLRLLANFALRHFFFDQPGVADTLAARREPGPHDYARMFDKVCRDTAHLMVEWMRVGFVHGVMNTDNMSVLGLTIDYGPYGWLEDFDPTWTPNTTDAQGRRYRFGNQPRVAEWNLAQFGNALMPLVERAELLEAGLEAYRSELASLQQDMMARKLGLSNLHLQSPAEDGGPSEDRRLVEEMLDVLQLVETDMTLFYRNLARLPGKSQEAAEMDEDSLRSPLAAAYYQPEQLTPDAVRQIDAWLRKYVARVERDAQSDPERRQLMNRSNPKYVLRNYLAQQAIDQARQGHPEAIMELLDVLRRPYDEQPGRESFAERRPEWARHRPGCSMLSCSS